MFCGGYACASGWVNQEPQIMLVVLYFSPDVARDLSLVVAADTPRPLKALAQYLRRTQ